MDTGKLLKSLSSAVRPHAKVITPQHPPIHISDNARIPVFIPRVPEAYGRKEDATQPRICVSLSMIKALESKYDLFLAKAMTVGEPLTLYTFPQAEQLIAISRQVVEDADVNEEHWVVRLDDHDAYIPKIVGRIDVVQLRILSPIQTVWSIAVELSDEILLADSHSLEKGWHFVEVLFQKDARRRQSLFRFKQIQQIRTLTREQFYEVRQTQDLTKIKFEQDPFLNIW